MKKATDLRLMLVGDKATGKSGLVSAFTEGKFLNDYHVGPLDDKQVELVVDDRMVKLHLYETFGFDVCANEAMRTRMYATAHVVLICFAIDNMETLKNVEKYGQEVNTFCPKMPIILIGNKADQRTNPEVLEELKEVGQGLVSTETGQELADKIGACAFLECSSKMNEGVENVFETAARAALKSKGLHKESCLLL